MVSTGRDNKENYGGEGLAHKRNDEMENQKVPENGRKKARDMQADLGMSGE